MDQNKLSYFFEKYRSSSDEELIETHNRITELADEAADALVKVLKEKGLSLPIQESRSPAITTGENPVDRATQTKISSELWNGSLSNRIKNQCGGLALIFSIPILGWQGLRVGGLWFFVFAGFAMYLGRQIGRNYTRSVCSNGDRSIEEKRKTLQIASTLLWPALLVSFILGAVVAGAIR